MTLKTPATIDDLFRVEGKAELVNGEVVLMPATGALPGFAGDEIFASLRDYARRTKRGRAVGDNKAFKVNLRHRGSFSPDAAYFQGPKPRAKMKYYDGAPVFAAEVRSEWDYGPAAERDIAAKRVDYFAAGTLVVWDVDMLSPHVVRVYRATDPLNPKVHGRGKWPKPSPLCRGGLCPWINCLNFRAPASSRLPSASVLQSWRRTAASWRSGRRRPPSPCPPASRPGAGRSARSCRPGSRRR
jgi:Uma2 family endonuclease